MNCEICGKEKTEWNIDDLVLQNTLKEMFPGINIDSKYVRQTGRAYRYTYACYCPKTKGVYGIEVARKKADNQARDNK
ncbi:MAG: hypothetical protein GWP19_03925 [Planctomycetia bacterium]|nr:hypothetical protein [Planctomycetia bacterium]